jgi:hypothetical protein
LLRLDRSISGESVFPRAKKRQKSHGRIAADERGLRAGSCRFQVEQLHLLAAFAAFGWIWLWRKAKKPLNRIAADGRDSPDAYPIDPASESICCVWIDLPVAQNVFSRSENRKSHVSRTAARGERGLRAGSCRFQVGQLHLLAASAVLGSIC